MTKHFSKEELEEELKVLRDGFSSRGGLIINLRDELVKVANLNESLADTLEAVCAENEHLSRKLAGMEALAQDLYLKNIKMEAERSFSAGEKMAQTMLGKTFF